MANLKLNVNDVADPPRDEIAAVHVERFPYRVISEAGIFKNGKQYEKGETVELDRDTGERFVAAGDVEEL